jgi:hypothetical protein
LFFLIFPGFLFQYVPVYKKTCILIDISLFFKG